LQAESSKPLSRYANEIPDTKSNQPAVKVADKSRFWMMDTKCIIVTTAWAASEPGAYEKISDDKLYRARANM